MPDDVRSLLQPGCTALLEQYKANIHDVQALQKICIEDILPSMVDELGLDDGAEEWAKEWMRDNSTLFQVLRRNNFTRSAAMEWIRKTLIWRRDHLLPKHLSSKPKSYSRLHCLPPQVRDPFGRPILVIEATSMDQSAAVYQDLFLQAIERLRAHLQTLNEMTNWSDPSFQYVVLLDLKSLKVKTSSLDLVTWFMKDVMPQFPGILAAVFMINYSWTHSGLWSIAKRVLPARALSIVFFPSQKELMEYFTANALPKELGGALAPITDLDDPLHSDSLSSTQRSTPGTPPPPYSSESLTSRTNGNSAPDEEVLDGANPKPPPSSSVASTRLNIPERIRSFISLSPTSAFNPFYGYPAELSANGSAHRHPYGRRRKRDLARTLLVLLWLRWRRVITACLWFAAMLLAVRSWLRSGLVGPKVLLGSAKALSPTKLKNKFNR